MKLDVQISGLTNLRKRFDRLPEKSKKLVRDALTKAGFVVERKSKQITPVDTGRLRNSISVSTSLLMRAEPHVVISPHTSYAKYVHDRKAKHPTGDWKYMTRGYSASRTQIKSIMKKLLKDIKNSL